MLRIIRRFSKHCSYGLQGESRSFINSKTADTRHGFAQSMRPLVSRTALKFIVTSAMTHNPKFTAPRIRRDRRDNEPKCCFAQVSSPSQWHGASFAKFVLRMPHRASFLQDDSSTKHSKTNPHSCVLAQLSVLLYYLCTSCKPRDAYPSSDATSL
jgi:hypothetical protein